MHPLEVCEFDPLLIADIDIYDTKKLMYQLCLNKMKLSMDDPKGVFNDEDFVNKVRFHKTKKAMILGPKDDRDIWTVKPNIDECMYIIIPEITEHSQGTYVCKSQFSGKTYIEHFVMLNAILPYMSLRVCYEEPYANNIYNCIQTFIANNKLPDSQHTALIKYLTCEQDHLLIEAQDPLSTDFLFKTIRVCMESIKRIAYV